jgi:hypothetical protein
MRSQPTAGVDERMLALVYRVAGQLGYSRNANVRLCRRVFLGARSWLLVRRTVAVPMIGRRDVTNVGRGVRARYLLILRSALGPTIDRDRLNNALADAVLADELALLPPRQQFVIRLATVEHCTVRQIIERTGWTQAQVLRLLRAGLHTITVRGHAATA